MIGLDGLSLPSDTCVMNLSSDVKEVMKSQELGKWLVKHSVELDDLEGLKKIYGNAARDKFWTESIEKYYEIFKDSDGFSHLVKQIEDFLEHPNYVVMKDTLEEYEQNSSVQLFRHKKKDTIVFGNICGVKNSLGLVSSIINTIREAENGGPINFRKNYDVEAKISFEQIEYELKQKNLFSKEAVKHRGSIINDRGWNLLNNLIDCITDSKFSSNFRFLIHGIIEQLDPYVKYHTLHSDMSLDYVMPEISDRTHVRGYVNEDGKIIDYEETGQPHLINDDLNEMEAIYNMHIKFQNGCYLKAKEAKIRVMKNIVFYSGTSKSLQEEDYILEQKLKEMTADSLVLLNEPYIGVIRESFETRLNKAFEAVRKCQETGAVVCVNCNPVLYERLSS